MIVDDSIVRGNTLKHIIKLLRENNVNKIFVVSGSTITGVTEATENFFSWVTISSLVVSVNVEPDLGFIAIRWYSLAYIFGILIGWWYGKKIILNNLNLF